MIMIASGSVLAIAAVLFSGVLSPDKSPPRSSSERTAVQQDQSGAQVPSTQSVVRLGPVKEPNATASDLAWKLYVNSRYGVTVEYPSQLFTAGDPPADNSGVVSTPPTVAAFLFIPAPMRLSNLSMN
jgi:hypothetical protein